MEIRREVYIENFTEWVIFQDFMIKYEFRNLNDFYNMPNMAYPYTKKFTVQLWDQETFEGYQKGRDAPMYMRDVEKPRVYIGGGNLSGEELSIYQLIEELRALIEGETLGLI